MTPLTLERLNESIMACKKFNDKLTNSQKGMIFTKILEACIEVKLRCYQMTENENENGKIVFEEDKQQRGEGEMKKGKEEDEETEREREREKEKEKLLKRVDISGPNMNATTSQNNKQNKNNDKGDKGKGINSN